MMVILMPEGGVKRGQALVDLYKDDAYMAVHSAALVLHMLPKAGSRHGPALRHLVRSDRGNPYGAVLTDIRDFLKFRFRVKGLAIPGDASPATIWERLASLGTDDVDVLAEAAEAQACTILTYVISTLDKLSGIRMVSIEGFTASLRDLRDMLRDVARCMYPYGSESFDPMDKMVFREPSAAENE